ncbi:MAG: adenylate/guanylate cyclase domain-containing protein [Chloroflexi bacterium]|nr:adenylate/guanylate cyclase domain-containing protein [Chloroflexota bacterium]
MSVYTGPAPEVDQRRLDQLVSQAIQAGADDAITRRLGEHLAQAPDDRVASMRAFELADLWGTERRETLATFLRGTTVGLLDLKWDILCPFCRVPTGEFGSLSEVTGQSHCPSCAMTVDVNFDQLVEVRFKPAPAIRTASVGVYCVGGPRNTPHVVAQAELGAAQALRWELQVPDGQYRLRSPQGGAALIEVGREGVSGRVGVALESHEMVPLFLQVNGNRVDLSVESHLDGPALVALEEQSWTDTAATAALVSTMGEFRDLFSSEVLAPGLQVAIERLALVFTDLAGSTALYERIGQARAFRLVQDHFVVLDAAIRDHNGSIIKTIGDAVMAVFPTAMDAAAAAAIQMQCGMQQLAVAEGVDAPRLLKVGIHTGACLAVTLNEKLDYFGTVVNIAARTEHEAKGGEIMVTSDAWEDGGVAELLEAAATSVETTQAMLKGITEAVDLHRVIGIKC